jgi:hypothetical protein
MTSGSEVDSRLKAAVNGHSRVSLTAGARYISLPVFYYKDIVTHIWCFEVTVTSLFPR